MASHDLEASFGADDLAIGGEEFVADGARAESLAMLIWLSELSRDERIRAAAQLGHPEVLDEPKTIGRYRLEALLGTGGYGAVFRAIDCQLNRAVALKLAWPSILVDPEASRRFVEEPRTTAGLAHEGIVDVRDSGMIELVPFIALELIEGPTLAQWMARESFVRPEVAAEIIRCVAGAVDCAHSHGIIHRDLKPSNILLRPAPGRTTLPFQPMVTDFGLARRPPGIELSLVTGSSIIIGTDPYLSPEQAAGNAADVGAASDIFSLGVILYELVAGRRPFEGETAVVTRELIQNEEPPSISGLRRGVPKDLETIILKCLEKAPTQRYESASSLADDLDRFLKHQPIRARRIGPLARGWKYAKRKPTSVALASMVLLGMILLASLGGAWMADRISSATQIAITEERESRQRYGVLIQRADDAFRSGNRRAVAELLKESRSISGEGEKPGIEWNYLWRAINDADHRWKAHADGVHVVRFSPKGDTLVSGGDDGRVVCWDTTNWLKTRERMPYVGDVNVVEFSDDGSLLAAGGDDGRVVVYRTDDYETVFDEQVLDKNVLTLAWLGAERKVTVGGSGPILVVVDPISGEQKRSDPIKASDTGLPDNNYPIKQIDNAAYWKAASNLVVDAKPLSHHTIDPQSLASIQSVERPYRSGLATGGPGGEFLVRSVYDDARREKTALQLVNSGKTVVASFAIPDRLRSVRFSRDGETLVAAADNGNAWTWRTADILSGSEPTPRRFMAHDDRTASVDMSPDGRCLASGGWDGHVNVWSGRRWDADFNVDLESEPVYVCFSPNGRLFALISGDRADLYRPWRVELYDVLTGTRLWRRSTAAYLLYNIRERKTVPAVFAPSGEAIALIEDGRTLTERDLKTGEVIHSYTMPGDESAVDINYSEDHEVLTVRSSRGDVRDWTFVDRVHSFDRNHGTIRRSESAPEPDCLGQYQTALGNVWVHRLERQFILSETSSSVSGITVGGLGDRATTIGNSPGGRLFFAGDEQGVVYFWDLLHPSVTQKYLGHRSAISRLWASRDEDRLLSFSLDGTVRIWDVITGMELVRIGTADEPVVAMAFDAADELLILAVKNLSRYGLKIIPLATQVERKHAIAPK